MILPEASPVPNLIFCRWFYTSVDLCQNIFVSFNFPSLFFPPLPTRLFTSMGNSSEILSSSSRDAATSLGCANLIFFFFFLLRWIWLHQLHVILHWIMADWRPPNPESGGHPPCRFLPLYIYDHPLFKFEFEYGFIPQHYLTSFAVCPILRKRVLFNKKKKNRK